MKGLFKSAAIVIAALSLTIGFQSCNSVKPIDKTALNGYWELKTLKGEEAKSAFSGKTPNIEFDFDKNIAHGNGGCNNFTGPFTITEKNEFSAPNFAVTRMACFADNKESLFLSTLSTPNMEMSIDEAGVLTFSSGKDVVMQFVKGDKENPTVNAPALSPESLAGKWNLTMLADADINTLFKERKPTIEFGNDNSVFGYAGCNTYRSAYELEGNTLTFKLPAMTMMACPSLEGEGKFTSALTGAPVQVRINGDKLIFSKAGKTVLEFTKDASK